MTDVWNVPLSEERSLTIRQFCLAEDITEEQWDDLFELGYAPKMDDYIFGLGTRITAQSRRDWHARMAILLPVTTAEVDDPPQG
jgi:hypothetical protein